MKIYVKNYLLSSKLINVTSHFIRRNLTPYGRMASVMTLENSSSLCFLTLVTEELWGYCTEGPNDTG